MNDAVVFRFRICFSNENRIRRSLDHDHDEQDDQNQSYNTSANDHSQRRRRVGRRRSRFASTHGIRDGLGCAENVEFVQLGLVQSDEGGFEGAILRRVERAEADSD